MKVESFEFVIKITTIHSQKVNSRERHLFTGHHFVRTHEGWSAHDEYWFQTLIENRTCGNDWRISGGRIWWWSKIMCTYKIKFIIVEKRRYQDWRRDDLIDWHPDYVPSDERCLDDDDSDYARWEARVHYILRHASLERSFFHGEVSSWIYRNISQVESKIDRIFSNFFFLNYFVL